MSNFIPLSFRIGECWILFLSLVRLWYCQLKAPTRTTASKKGSGYVSALGPLGFTVLLRLNPCDPGLCGVNIECVGSEEIPGRAASDFSQEVPTTPAATARPADATTSLWLNTMADRNVPRPAQGGTEQSH
ncbi:hypothetical protein Q5P01_016016 [Channa striata]|uniref:Uncharacterized protein n=1 Tax=Channa striata TaxID=64152 RepID=A0AA88MG58_CHASR|nr:hypothetical protein Q5P01_016016 [Channa striata]